MKRSIITVMALVLAIFFALPAFSAIPTPLVTVTLSKRVVITQEQLDEKMKLFGDSATEDEVLSYMISQEVLSQAMTRDGYTASKLSEAQKDAILRQGIEQQVGQTLTDEQYEYILQTQLGDDISAYRDYFVEQALIEQYVYDMKKDMFNDEGLIPSDADIEAFYKKNKSSFISPENVKLSHIYFKFNDDKAAALKKATDVLNQIKNGKITFEKAVSLYSEDASSIESAGEIGWLSIEDEDTLSYMGENFFDKVFQLDAGEISDVIESLAGYHIVKVAVHNDTRILALTDKISPTESVTVYDYLQSYLYSLNRSTMLSNAYNSLIEDLLASAVIKYTNK